MYRSRIPQYNSCLYLFYLICLTPLLAILFIVLLSLLSVSQWHHIDTLKPLQAV
jgi:hypothetical protein